MSQLQGLLGLQGLLDDLLLLHDPSGQEFRRGQGHAALTAARLFCDLFFPFPSLVDLFPLIFLPHTRPSTSDNFRGSLGCKIWASGPKFEIFISPADQFTVCKRYTLLPAYLL